METNRNGRKKPMVKIMALVILTLMVMSMIPTTAGTSRVQPKNQNNIEAISDQYIKYDMLQDQDDIVDKEDALISFESVVTNSLDHSQSI